MTEKNMPTSPLPPESGTAQPTQPAAPAPPAPEAKVKVKDREGRGFGAPVVGGIAAATLLIGGLAGGIIGYAVHSDGPDGFREGPPGQRFEHDGPGPGMGMPQPPSGQPDQQQDDGSGTDGSGTES